MAADNSAGIMRKLALGLGAGVIFLVVVGAVGYWWSNRRPARPREVSSSAVFLWAPYVGAPAPRRGWWLDCRSSTNGAARCRLSDIEGKLKYEGDFISYDGNPVASSELKIDPEKSRELGVWVDHTNVPLVYLSNGRILVPEGEYQQAVRVLKQRLAR